MNSLLNQAELEKAAGDLAPFMRGLLATQEKIVDRLDAVERKQEAMDNKLSDLVDAFPNADMDGHRRYHETMMEMLEERRRLRVAIQEKTISGLVWASIVFLSLAVLRYVRSFFGMA